jgi:hypothetical protein
LDIFKRNNYGGQNRTVYRVVSLRTGRELTFKSPARFRKEVDPAAAKEAEEVSRIMDEVDSPAATRRANGGGEQRPDPTGTTGSGRTNTASTLVPTGEPACSMNPGTLQLYHCTDPGCPRHGERNRLIDRVSPPKRTSLKDRLHDTRFDGVTLPAELEKFLGWMEKVKGHKGEVLEALRAGFTEGWHKALLCLETKS